MNKGTVYNSYKHHFYNGGSLVKTGIYVIMAIFTALF